MDNNQLFGRFYSRLAREGWIRAFVVGLIVGFSAALVSGLLTFLLIYSGWLAATITFVLATAAGTVFAYYKHFKPNAKTVARRLDEMGLEERMVTMLEFEKDESYIAMLQREDAKARLNKLRPKQVKISVLGFPILLAGIALLLSASMVTISVLSASGLSGWTPPGVDAHPDEYYDVVYLASEGGRVEGPTEQSIYYGENAEFVMAVADEGYMFDKWDDEITDAERRDENITEPKTITAIFSKMQDSGAGGQGDGGGGGGEEGESQETGEPDVPVDPEDQENTENQGPPPQGNEGGTPGTPGGEYDPGNKIIDGETYYRDEFEAYYDLCMQRLEEGEDLTPEQKAFIEMYFGILV